MKPAEYNLKQIDSGLLNGDMLVELVKFWQEHHELEIDGYAGPVTQASIDAAMAPGIREAPEGVIYTINWPVWDGPATRQPKNRRELYELLGNPGVGRLDKNWYRANIIELHASHGTRLPGAPARQYVHIHRECEPYAREGLRRATLVCPDYAIERIGSHNFRHIRHDPSQPLSVHSFGAALDINPHQNSGRWFKKGEVPKAWSPEWLAIWPKSIPEPFVRAMQSCGWAWGSDWDEDGDVTDHTYMDPMHFEWVARDGNAYQV